MKTLVLLYFPDAKIPQSCKILTKLVTKL